MFIEKIVDISIKKKICNDILRNLPKWFGIEQSIQEYVEGVGDKDFFVALDKDDYIGFIAVDYPYNKIANLYVLGVKEKYHSKGIGTMLYSHVEENARSKGYDYMSVYTLSAQSSDENYAKTREFYHKQGFVDTYESDKIWGEENPFLLMVKFIG